MNQSLMKTNNNKIDYELSSKWVFIDSTETLVNKSTSYLSGLIKYLKNSDREDLIDLVLDCVIEGKLKEELQSNMWSIPMSNAKSIKGDYYSLPIGAKKLIESFSRLVTTKFIITYNVNSIVYFVVLITSFSAENVRKYYDINSDLVDVTKYVVFLKVSEIENADFEEYPENAIIVEF